jgi:hypothetical protein
MHFLISYLKQEDEEAKKALVETVKMKKCLG